MSSARAFFFFAILTLAVSPSCKPKPGERCPPGLRRCDDTKTMLACTPGGTWELAPCNGAKGCTESGNDVKCDVDRTSKGDLCPGQADTTMCLADSKTEMLACRGGLWKITQCRGPKGCAAAPQGGAFCDDSIAEAGDPCTETSTDPVCSLDGAKKLFCDKGKYVVGYLCSGPKKCGPGTEEDARLRCDLSGPHEIDEVCGLGAANANGCTADKRTSVHCDVARKKYVKTVDCPGMFGCAADHCDSGISSVGTGCNEGDRVCGDDKKSLLTCKEVKAKDGKSSSWEYVVDRVCGDPGCVPKAGKLVCP